MKSLQNSWRRVCSEIRSIETAETIFEKLVTCYSEPHRKYHTLQHLRECIENFELIKEQANYQNEVEVALWFHDAIYDLKSSCNEEKSADWAKETAIQMGYSVESANRIFNLIMITKHSALPNTNDEKILVDIDLSILGANENRFLEYELQIRQEYSFVPDFIFKNKRCAILKEFLNRKTIYNTSLFHGRLESNARINLKKSLLLLSS